jgi:hypothetical protein
LIPSSNPVRLRQYVRALTSNTGFVPILPGATAIRFRVPQGTQQEITVRERRDASLEMGVMVRDTEGWLQSDVAPLDEFGLFGGARPPSKLIPNPRLVLSAQDNDLYLKLPPSLPLRVRDWAQAKLSGARRDE